MKRESFCILAITKAKNPDNIPGVPTLGRWVDPDTGAVYVEQGRLIHHSILEYDRVLALADELGEKAIVSVDCYGGTHLVWLDSRTPEYLGLWREISEKEASEGDYTRIETGSAPRYFRAGGYS